MRAEKSSERASTIFVRKACKSVLQASPGSADLERLRQYRMLPSMSRLGSPYDNAACESFLKTLKREEIYAGNYRDFEDLREHLEEFIER